MNDLKISIVMSYHNFRKIQLINTLNQFENLYSNKYNFEVVIVDDNSNEEFKLYDIINNYSFRINYIIISKEEKGDRINPCIAYNKGFKESTGDIIIIQNPECYHVGNIIDYIYKNIDESKYLTFSCYSTNSHELTEELINSDNKFDKINDDNFNNKNLCNYGILWYNHPMYRDVSYHFCSAIYKSKLDILGGFDENFGNGYCFDDDELLLSIKYNLKLNIFNIDPSEVFVIHQYHERNDSFNISCENDNNIIKQKWLLNKNLFESKKNIYI